MVCLLSKRHRPSPPHALIALLLSAQLATSGCYRGFHNALAHGSKHTWCGKRMVTAARPAGAAAAAGAAARLPPLLAALPLAPAAAAPAAWPPARPPTRLGPVRTAGAAAAQCCAHPRCVPGWPPPPICGGRLAGLQAAVVPAAALWLRRLLPGCPLPWLQIPSPPAAPAQASRCPARKCMVQHKQAECGAAQAG